MWLFLIGGIGLAVYSMVKDYRSSKSEAVVNGVRSCDDPPLPAAAVERLAVWGAAGGDGSDPCRLFLRTSQKGHLT